MAPTKRFVKHAGLGALALLSLSVLLWQRTADRSSPQMPDPARPSAAPAAAVGLADTPRTADTVPVAALTPAPAQPAPETSERRPAPPVRPAPRVILHGLTCPGCEPPDAYVFLDGRRIRDTIVELELGRRQMLTVSLWGHKTWVEFFRPRPGQRFDRTVILVPDTARPPSSATPDWPRP